MSSGAIRVYLGNRLNIKGTITMRSIFEKSALALMVMLIGFSPLATEASSPRGLSDSNTVNVKDYGATGNGSTDDTSAISAAVSTAPVSGNAILNVYFPTGT
jgi:Pectate lyase superfamily protein